MSATGLEVFDTTLHKTHRWLNELMLIMGWQDRHRAYLAMRVTLHALRDRLTVEEAAQFAAQLPMLIRGFYYEGWDPTGKPVKERHLDQFLAHIVQSMRGDEPVNPKEIAEGVFAVLARRISEGEIEDVKHVLPAEIRSLWPAAPVGAGAGSGLGRSPSPTPLP
jgi:uncharacterized protein (DUF2267 family)